MPRGVAVTGEPTHHMLVRPTASALWSPGGLNGRQVAEAAREGRPYLPVSFITDYTGTVPDDRLAPGMETIGGPFESDVLVDEVRATAERR